MSEAFFANNSGSYLKSFHADPLSGESKLGSSRSA